MWLDGVLQSRTPTYGANTNATQCIHTRIGGNSKDLVLDEIRLYDGALSPARIKEVYHAGGDSSPTRSLHSPSKQIALYLVKPISHIVRVPDTPPVDAEETATVEIVAAPGEFEPASFIIYTRNGLRRVCFEASDLTGPGGSIEAQNIDIRSVKCWYQAGTAWQGVRGDPSTRFLVPELLLKDDSLVRVDYEKQVNYVNVHELNGDQYVDMSQVDPKKQPGMKNSEFPVYDSPVLLPLNVPANTYKQIWITIHVPEEAKPGRYGGRIEVSADGKPLEGVELSLRVLPFRLAEPKTYYDSGRAFTLSIYYKGILVWDREGELRGWHKNETQFRADLKNMMEHGVTSPMILQLEVDDDLRHFEQVLRIREEVGMINDPLFLLGKERNLGFGNTTDPGEIKQAQKRLEQILAVAKKHGIEQVFVYGLDEAKGERMAKQKAIWNAFHEVGARIFVAGYMRPDSDSFKLVGDTLDILINAGVPRREFAAKWHSTGKKIWCYDTLRPEWKIQKSTGGITVWCYGRRISTGRARTCIIMATAIRGMTSTRRCGGITISRIQPLTV